MNKILYCVCFYLSFHITACQTFADEVQNVKQPVLATETASNSPVKADEKPSDKNARPAEHIKIRQVRALDPAVFTMIRPYTLDRTPVKLPREQILD